MERLSLFQFAPGINSRTVLETALCTMDKIAGILSNWRDYRVEGIAKNIACLGFPVVVVFELVKMISCNGSTLEAYMAALRL